MNNTHMRIAVKRLASLLIIAAAALLLSLGDIHIALAQETGVLRNYKRGDKLPPIAMKSVNDNKHQTFIPGSGKPAAVMFFAVRPEFRKKRSLEFVSTLAELSSRYGQRIDIVCVFSDSREADTVRNFMEKNSIDLTVFNDSKKRAHNEYGVFMMPLVVFADQEGKLHEVIPYTYNIRKIIDSNIKYLLGEWSRAELISALKPKEKKVRSKEEKEYIRRVNYGRIMYSKKMFGQAVREFSAAISLMPRLLDAHVDLGFAYLASRDLVRAEASFREALRINAESDDAISGLGLAYYRSGEVDSAFVELEKAFIAPNPRLDVVIALAEIYEERGLDEKANRLNKLAVERLMMMYEQRWK